MEYPMICFNGPRANPDMKSYSDRAKWSLVGVVIHEVGHNYFPMTVNSDERQWTWMDEGVNSFLEHLAETEWKDFPADRALPKNITSYMLSENQVPIMTNSESVLQFGNNAYGKPATALNILRETVMGRELFDFSFKTYAQRWKFKRPMPADLFRTMEDASGVDLDWFWRGWFYTTDHVDISIEDVKLFKVDKKTPEELKDPAVAKAFDDFMATLSDKEKALVNADYNFYIVSLKNKGGLVMPVILKTEYADGTSDTVRIPAEIWRYNNFDVTKLIVTKKEAKNIVLDPNLETADADLTNNSWKKTVVPTRFQVFKGSQGRRPAPTSTPAPIGVAPTTSVVAMVKGLTGKWNTEIEQAGFSVTINLVQDGEKLTGTVEFPQSPTPVPISDAVVNADGFSFKVNTPFGVITMKGKQNNAQITGTLDAPQGSTTFSGTKAP
jgi:hypothetical protein